MQQKAVPAENAKTCTPEDSCANRDVDAHGAQVRALEEALAQKNRVILELESALAKPQNGSARFGRSHVHLLAGFKRNDFNGHVPANLTGWSWLAPGRRRKRRRLTSDYQTIAESPLFDADWYLANNSDVATKGEDPVLHYLLHGAREGRAPGPLFDGVAYLRANADVANAQLNPLLHYLKKGRAENRLIDGRRSGRAPTVVSGDGEHPSAASSLNSLAGPSLRPESDSIDIDRSLAVPFSYVVEPKAAPGRVAAILDIYHDDLAIELASYLRNIPGGVDVFISTTDSDRKSAIEKTFASWASGTIEVRVARNSGRNIAAVEIEFREVYDRYDFVLNLRRKRSPIWSEVGAHWRSYLLESLLGTPLVVTSIFQAFEQNSRLGMVAAQHFQPVRNWFHWGANLERARRLAARMGFSIDPDAAMDFRSGSMFWARSAALRPLFELEANTVGLDSENGGSTVGHAAERMYFHICEKAGYDWIKVARTDLLIDAPSVAKVKNEDQLKQFFQRGVSQHVEQHAAPPRTAGVIEVDKFDEQFYLDYYPDVSQAIERGGHKSAEEHYLRFGFEEGRLPYHDPWQLLSRKFGVGAEPLGLYSWESLEAKIKPLQGRLCSERRPTTNIFIPTMDPDIFFGGYIAFFHFLCRLAEAGSRLRFVVLEDNCTFPWFLKGIAGRERWVKAFKNAEFINLTLRDRSLDIHEADAIIVYSAWMALLARDAIQLLTSGKAGFFVQEFESVFHEYDSSRFLVSSAYRVPHVPIFNTRALHDYFKKHRIGAFSRSDKDQLSFEHNIGSAPTKQNERTFGKRLLFYARPEAHAARNLFEIGILALRAALRAGIIDETWKIVGIGSLVQYKLTLDEAGKFIVPVLPRVEEHEYQNFINGFDVGLSLMSSPHPGVVHFEWAVQGIATVVNCTPERDRSFFDSYDLPIVPADPDVDGIVLALAKAVELARKGYTRRDDARRSFATSWDDSFSPQFIAQVISSCEISIESGSNRSEGPQLVTDSPARNF